MRRGFFRIVAGSVLLFLQVISFIGNGSIFVTTSSGFLYDLFFNIGYHAFGISGILLLVFGIRACRNDLFSWLILHDNNSPVHTVVKWAGVVLSVLLCIDSLIYIVQYLPNMIYYADIVVSSLFFFFGSLSLSVFSLAYMYKRPSCLLSAAFIFTGICYIYEVVSSNAGVSIQLLYLSILPRLVVAVLYIVIAVMLYTESFSVGAVKALGWIAFVLEIVRRVIYPVLADSTYIFRNMSYDLELLFAVVLMVYVCVLKINTQRYGPVTVGNDSSDPDRQAESLQYEDVPNGSVGQGSYETAPAPDDVMFCRMCGERLSGDSSFCHKCGTKAR